MAKEVKNLTNIKLTEGDDGIFLHFASKGKKVGILLSLFLSHGSIGNSTIEAWAREQLDKEDTLSFKGIPLPVRESLEN